MLVGRKYRVTCVEAAESSCPSRLTTQMVARQIVCTVFSLPRISGRGFT